MITPTPILGVFLLTSRGQDIPYTGADIENSPGNITLQLVNGAYPGEEVSIYANGVLQSTYAAGPNSLGEQQEFPPATAPLGNTTFTAVATNPGDTPSVPSNAVSLFEVPAPVNGVSSSDVSSLTIASLLSSGYGFFLTGGTMAVTLVDGTLSFGPTTNEALLQRLYEGLLERPADAAGLAVTDTQLSSGTPASTVATELVNSSEYAALHGIQTDAQFLQTAFQGLLGRSPSTGEATSFLGELSAGVTRGAVAAGIAAGTESQTHLVSTTTQLFARNTFGTVAHEAYETGFGREVDLPALANIQAGFASSALTATQLFAAIASSSEFTAMHGAQDNATYVSSLYEAGLGRMPDPQSAAVDVAALVNGSITRAGLLQSIATSSEAAAHLTATPLLPVT